MTIVRQVESGDVEWGLDDQGNPVFLGPSGFPNMPLGGGSGFRLAHAENVDAAGVLGVSAKAQLRGMVIEVVAPPSGTVRVTGKVAYATGSALGTLSGLSVTNEARSVQYDGGYAAKPTIAAGVVNPPAVDVTREGLIPGEVYTFALCGEAIGGTSNFATPFTLDAYAVVL